MLRLAKCPSVRLSSLLIIQCYTYFKGANRFVFGTDIVKMKTFILKTSDGVDEVWDWEIIPIALPGDEARGIKAYMNRWHLL